MGPLLELRRHRLNILRSFIDFVAVSDACMWWWKRLEAPISRVTAGAATAEQFPENVEIRRHANAMLFANRL
jgi:hypothetical protein